MSSATHKPPQPNTGRSSETRDLLVRTAILLFAARGVQGVSLRAVGEAAGQRNTAVVHYYFGDRETLLEAALDMILSAIREDLTAVDAARLGLRLEGPTSKQREAVEFAFLPLIALPQRHPEWGKAGIQLLARVLLGDASDLAHQLERKTISDTAELVALFGPFAPDLSESQIKLRIDFAVVSVVCSVTAGAYLTSTEAGTDEDIALADRIEALLDFIVAGLFGPTGERSIE
jgi:AcrR family transcriptional regulator